MLKLNSAPTEPTWIDLLPGVRLELAPPTVLDLTVARAAAGQVYRDAAAIDGAEPDPDLSTKATVAMVGAYARRRIIGWEGVGDEADEPVAATPDAIDAFMRVWPAYDAFDRLVMNAALTSTDVLIA